MGHGIQNWLECCQMHQFIFGSHMLAQLLECFYKLPEYFEIKHVTGDLSRRGSWCFLLFFGLENPQKQWLFLLQFRTCSFSTVLSRTLKWRTKNEKELEIFTRCFKNFFKINQSINFLPSLANLKTAWSSYQIGYHIISRIGSLKIITNEQKPMIHFNSKVRKNQEVSRALFYSIPFIQVMSNTYAEAGQTPERALGQKSGWGA